MSDIGLNKASATGGNEALVNNFQRINHGTYQARFNNRYHPTYVRISPDSLVGSVSPRLAGIANRIVTMAINMLITGIEIWGPNLPKCLQIQPRARIPKTTGSAET
jgi:hypothetical protein